MGWDMSDKVGFWDSSAGKVLGVILLGLVIVGMALGLLRGCRHELSGYKRLVGIEDEAAEQAAAERAARAALPKVDGNKIPIIWDDRWLLPDPKDKTTFSYVGKSQRSDLYFGAIVWTRDAAVKELKWTVIPRADYVAHKNQSRD